MKKSSSKELILELLDRHKTFLLALALACTWAWVIVTNVGRGW